METPMQSKKFVAYLIAELTWKVIAILTLFWGQDKMPGQIFMVLMAIIITAGFLEVGYILGQSYIDKYVRVAEIVANGKDKPPKPTE